MYALKSLGPGGLTDNKGIASKSDARMRSANKHTQYDSKHKLSYLTSSWIHNVIEYAKCKHYDVLCHVITVMLKISALRTVMKKLNHGETSRMKFKSANRDSIQELAMVMKPNI